jgi:N-acetylglucosamine kinase-like BadF-type ATPase
VGVVLGVDGGNSKTELVVATAEGEVLASVRGPGSNSHGVGAEGTAAVVADLFAESGHQGPVDRGVFFLCGADVPADIAELTAAVNGLGIARDVMVDNDTFALLRAGTDGADAIAVICGAGINCVGRSAAGAVARYPALGWETGDWGGAEMLAREAIFHAARGEDGRGRHTALTELVRGHFDAPSVEALGLDFHYRRLPAARLGEVAPLVLTAASAGDPVAGGLVERLAEEVGLWVRRALNDLSLEVADVVLGGGMLRDARGVLWDAIVSRLAVGCRPLALSAPPVLGAVLAALDSVGATDAAKARVREALPAR